MRLFASIRPPEEVREHLVTALRPIRDGHGPFLRWMDPDEWHLTVAFYGERPDGSVDELAEHIAAAAALSTSDTLDLHLRGAGSFSGRTLWIGVGGDVAPLRRLMAACAHDPFAVPGDPDPADDTAFTPDFTGFSPDFAGSLGAGSRHSHRAGNAGRSGSRGSRSGDQRERRRAHLTVPRLRAREQGGRRDGRRAGRRSGWAGDRRGVGFAGDRAHGRDLARPARHDGADLLRDVVHALSVYSGPSWTTTEIELVSSHLGEGRSGGALHETVATIPFAAGR